MKVKHKLMTVGAIALAGILVLGALFFQSQRIAEQTQWTITDVHMRILSSLQEMYAQGLQSEQATRNILLNPADKQARTNYAKADKDFREALNVAAGFVPSDMLSALKEIEGLWGNTHDLKVRVQELATFGDQVGASALLIEQETPLWRKLKDLLLQLRGVQEKSTKTLIEADQAGQAARLRLVIGTVSATALLVAAALLLTTRRIGLQLAATATFATRVAGGDLDGQLAIEGRDEIGTLADALRRMVATLKDRITESRAAAARAEGETEKARQAAEEARQARAQAERARAEGMHQAAERLAAVVDIIASASEELSAQVEQSSKGTETQRERVAEAATAMEEMNATVLEMARNASRAAEGSTQAKSKAQDGATVVQQVVAAIDSVSTQARALKDNMAALGKQTEDIGEIMEVISDIADQTNLLALNAAIEAARAGDAGRGFAVVADEVRKLAEKTMQATKQVGDSINGVQSGARGNVRSVEEAAREIDRATQLAGSSGQVLATIVTMVEASADEVRAIAAATEEQSAASEQISRGVEEINRISSETARAMGQSAQAVVELARQSQELSALVNEMRAA